VKFLILPLTAVLLVAAAPQKQKKPADVEVLETKARRGDGKIMIDVRVRNTSGKPVRGLVVYFDLLSAEDGVVASDSAVLDEDSVAAGDERSSQAITSDPPRAVKYKIRVSDAAERELRIVNAGPFPVE